MASELGGRVGNVVDMTAYIRMKDMPLLIQNSKDPKEVKSKEKVKKIKEPAKKKGK